MSYLIRAQGPHHPFEITGSLRVGSAPDAPVATIQSVIFAHHQWQEEHHVIQAVTICAAHVSSGSADGAIIRGDSELGFLVSGMINPLHDGHFSEDDAKRRVVSLAEHLADALQQSRISVVFGGVSYLLERASESAN